MRVGSLRMLRLSKVCVYCQTYFTFWLFAQVGLLIVGLLILLMVYPASRNYIFPQAPVAMVSAASGGLQKPKAGDTLGSKDRWAMCLLTPKQVRLLSAY
jgi:hypothetical protein